MTPGRRPLIGICAAIERVRWAVWDVEVNLSPRTYTDAVAGAGATAVILPPDDAAAESPDDVLEPLDALIVAGGSDIDPRSYGAEPLPQTYDQRSERDRFEIALCRRALERGLPLLGICRGMQVLNVARGGTLVQHLPELLDSDVHRPIPGSFGDHEVRLEPGSLAAAAVGAELITVKSAHHQGLDQLGEGIAASGWSVPDGLVEAIEIADHSFCLGVLWHPEEDTSSRIFGSLVEAVRGRVVTT